MSHALERLDSRDQQLRRRNLRIGLIVLVGLAGSISWILFGRARDYRSHKQECAESLAAAIRTHDPSTLESSQTCYAALARALPTPAHVFRERLTVDLKAEHESDAQTLKNRLAPELHPGIEHLLAGDFAKAEQSFAKVAERPGSVNRKLAGYYRELCRELHATSNRTDAPRSAP